MIARKMTDSERKKWWADKAREWLRNPNTDPELLFTASAGLSLGNPELSRECLEECRMRRKRVKKH